MNTLLMFTCLSAPNIVSFADVWSYEVRVPWRPSQGRDSGDTTHRICSVLLSNNLFRPSSTISNQKNIAATVSESRR